MEDQIKQTIPITREYLNLPGDIKLVSVYPDKLIYYSVNYRRKLKVNLQKKGEPAIDML